MGDEWTDDADGAPADTRRADQQDRADGPQEGSPVAASDPRSLTIDRGAEQSASPGVDEDRAAAEAAG